MERGPEATFHSGIRRLAKKLKDGDSVVLDDCNPTLSARSSLIASLKKQGADFTLEGIEFRPKGGLLQCRVVAQVLAAAEAERLEVERLTLSVDVESSDEEDSESDEDNKTSGGLESVLSRSSDLSQRERRREEVLMVRSSYLYSNTTRCAHY